MEHVYDPKAIRAERRAKAARMGGAGDPHAKVDASSWTPMEMMNTEAKTGLRPISKRAYKRGGKVEGAEAEVHAGRKPRKTGGRVAEKINRNVKEANAELGKPHDGGLKRGGRARRAGGGATENDAPRKGRDWSKTGITSAPFGATLVAPSTERYQAYNKAQWQNRNAAPPPGNRQARGVDPVDISASGDRQARGFDPVDISATDPAPRNRQSRGLPPSTDPASGDRQSRGFSPSNAPSRKTPVSNRREPTADELMNAYNSPGQNALLNAADVASKGPITPEDIAALRSAQRGPASESYTGGGESYTSGGLKRGGRARRADGGSLVPTKALDMSGRTIGGAGSRVFKKGGGVHPDEAEDRALVKRMVKSGARTGRASGGRAKGKTNIVIAINPNGQHARSPQGPGPQAPGMPSAGGPQAIPIPVPPPAPAMPMGQPVGLPTGGMPPLPRKRGGRLPHMTAGAGTGEGRLEKTAAYGLAPTGKR